jgi:hypothetical protein
MASRDQVSAPYENGSMRSMVVTLNKNYVTIPQHLDHTQLLGRFLFFNQRP